MKQVLVAGVGLLALAAANQPALSADLPPRPAPAPVYRAPPPVYVIYSWTGCYIGGHGGGVWITKDFLAATAIDFGGGLVGPAGRDLGSHDASGWIAGGQVGCNYQTGNFVFGIQGDYAWIAAEGTHADPFAATLGLDVTDRSNTKSLASVTGRVGYAWDRFLAYVKGGGAWEGDDYDAYFTGTGVTLAEGSETRFGWTAGVGGEYAFTDWITGFVEYNYYDFGSRSVTFSTPGGAVIGDVDIDERKSVVKAGINFKWGGALSARY
jgi:outer membrane immunogenic protein